MIGYHLETGAGIGSFDRRPRSRGSNNFGRGWTRGLGGLEI